MSHRVADDDVEARTGCEGDRAAALEQAGADLGPAQILKNRDVAAGALAGSAHARNQHRMIGVGTVREVQAEDVGRPRQ